MNSKIYETLEFNKIKNIISNFSVTNVGKQRVLDIKPSSNKFEVETWQKETTEAVSYLLRQHDIPLSPISTIEDTLAKIDLRRIFKYSRALKNK